MNDFTPTPEQQHVIETGRSALVVAGPGTGKTRTAIEKARLAVGAPHKSPQSQILFLSFSNAAVRRLAETAGLELSRSERRCLRLMTYHSCAAELLRLYGRFVGLPHSTRVIDTLEERLISIEEEWTDTDDAYQERLLRLARSRGLLAFSTLIPLATNLLRASERLRIIAARHYPLIIVDEFQDTSEAQWQLLQALGTGSQVVAFGDPNQIIYSSMHAATQARIAEFRQWKSGSEVTFSARNWRCGNAVILEFAEAMLHGTAYAVAAGSGVQVANIGYRNRLRVALTVIWKAIQDEAGSNHTIGFLTPTNAIAEDVAVSLRQPADGSVMPIPIHTRMARDEAAHDAVLLALTAIRDYAIVGDEMSCRRAAVALLAMDLAWNKRKKASKKALEGHARLLMNARSAREASRLTRLLESLVGPCNLPDFLPEFIACLGDNEDFRSTHKRITAHKTLAVQQVLHSDPALPLFDQLRATRRPRGLEGEDTAAGRTHILNYHKSKGREFDYVAMVVDPRGERASTPIDEQRRLYYVCATRAKRWLGILHYRGEMGRVLTPVMLGTGRS